mgnify:CR=1 FL=1
MTSRLGLDFFINLVAAGLARGTPILFATLGGIITERSGVMNLGIEGMMLVGAMTAFSTARSTNNALLGVCTGMLAGATLALAYAIVVVHLRADQVESLMSLEGALSRRPRVLCPPTTVVRKPSTPHDRYGNGAVQEQPHHR